MVRIYKNTNKNRIAIFSVMFILMWVGVGQYKKIGDIALINVIIGGTMAFFEFTDILILHSVKFRNFIKKIPVFRSLKKYEIQVADDYLLCGKGLIQIIETKNPSILKHAMLFLVPDGNGNMIYGRYYVQSTEDKIYVYTNCKMETIDKERALLKII